MKRDCHTGWLGFVITIATSNGGFGEVKGAGLRFCTKSLKYKQRRANMGDVTHEQANLMLKLYDLRREPKLREARDWFAANFHVKSAEDVMRLCPFGSKENTYMRMVAGYWEMVAGIVNRGLIDEDLFFETTGEQWGVWQQLRPVAGDFRKTFSNPKFLGNLEELCQRMEAWQEKRAPGSNEAMRKFQEQITKQMTQPQAQAAIA